jgi:ABC-2 type transport system permease protein
MRAQAQYRVSFWTELISSCLFGAVDLVVVVAMFRITRTLAGFDQPEVLVMAGLAGTGFAIADLVASPIERIRSHVRTGSLDAMLVRPLGALGQLLAADFAPRRVGRVVTMAAVLVLATRLAHVRWTPGRLALAAITPLAGAVLFGAVFVATAVVAFWWIESGEFANGFTYGGRDFSTYPMTIYDGALRAVLGYGVGFAFAGYYPALVLLDRPDPLGLPTLIGWLSPLAALPAVVVGGAVWRLGIRHYRSTGS